MTRAGRLRRLRVHLARGVGKIKKIAGYNRRRRQAIKRLLAEQGATVMFDNIDAAAVPDSAPAFAGYVDGRPEWQSFAPLRARFPRKPGLSIATSAEHDAHCLDVETGDASPDQVPEWIRRQQERWAGEEWRPCVYGSKSMIPLIIAACDQAGIKRGEYRVWSADWTYQPHICSPASCGATFTAEATQWTDRDAGGDKSLCAAGFFPGAR